MESLDLPQTNFFSRSDVEICCPELQEELHWISAVMDSIREAVYYTDTEFRILAWNRYAEELTGFSAEEAVGKHCSDILKHFSKEGNPLSLCEACPLLCKTTGKQQDESVEEEMWILTKDGRRKPVEVCCSLVKDKAGEVLGLVEVLRDRTRHMEVERMKEEFVSAVTHNLKSPLASLMGFAGLLANPKYGEISSRKLDFVQMIRRSGEMLLAMITNIVDVSRIEAGQMHYIFENFLLDDLLKELRNMFDVMAMETKINLQFSCPEETWVYADRNQIRQVFYNLISNAIRYTPDGGSVSILVSRGERLSIEVADTGCGIPESEQKKLFQRFVQLKGEPQGTGLGLYIVKHILLGHGSEITMKSAPGEGTSFFFCLEEGAPPDERLLRHGRLLLVGDDADSAHLATLALHEEGHTVEHVTSAMEALQKAPGFKPDLVLTYLTLPDLPAWEFSYALKVAPATREVPVVLFSPVRLPEWEEEFTRIIPIPLDMHLLRLTVQQILAH